VQVDLLQQHKHSGNVKEEEHESTEDEGKPDVGGNIQQPEVQVTPDLGDVKIEPMHTVVA